MKNSLNRNHMYVDNDTFNEPKKVAISSHTFFNIMLAVASISFVLTGLYVKYDGYGDKIAAHESRIVKMEDTLNKTSQRVEDVAQFLGAPRKN